MCPVKLFLSVFKYLSVTLSIVFLPRIIATHTTRVVLFCNNNLYFSPSLGTSLSHFAKCVFRNVVKLLKSV